MKTGKTLGSLARELERQAKAKKDYLVDTRLMRMETTGGVSRLNIPINGDTESLGINDIATRQIADRLKIPAGYYDRMKAEIPGLLDENVNAWFRQNPETRMVRTMDGQARAFLSNRYRRIDNYELAGAVLPLLADARGVQVVSCEVTERRMYIKVINKRMELEVKRGDVVQSGIVISNSEVGLGALKIEPLVYRLVCTNGLIAADYSQRKYHIGRIAASEEEEALELFRDETLEADDRAFLLKVQDTVKAAFDKAKFGLIVDSMRLATERQIEGDPIKAVEVLSERFQFSQVERSGIFRHLIQGGDLSGYGLVNAVTRTAQDSPNYDRATELERFGGQLLVLPQPDWRKIAEAA
ncbi:MAG: DUF932 domain-containing protein [Negativicutes bacterium]|nr:DUF932 domain-containing protein [Negativicutes bacterium]